jgi:hypothetical protein
VNPLASLLSPALYEALVELVDERVALGRQADGQRWLDVEAAAEYMSCSPAAVRGRISTGTLPVRGLGRTVVIDRLVLDELSATERMLFWFNDRVGGWVRVVLAASNDNSDPAPVLAEDELELMPVRVIGPNDDPSCAHRSATPGKSMLAVRVGEWTILRRGETRSERRTLLVGGGARWCV